MATRFKGPMCDLQRGSSCQAAALMIALVLAIASGCQKQASTDQGGATASDSTTASQLLERLAKTYRSAASYEDAGELRLSVQTAEGEAEQSPAIPFSVAFRKPGDIRIHALQASIVASQGELHASVDSLSNQVLVQPCAAPLTSDALFSDEMLLAAVTGQVDVSMPQLALLLSDDAIERLTAGASPRKLEDAEFNGAACYRVAVDGPRGVCVFWISKADGLLAKFEFGTDDLRKKFNVPRCDLWAEFNGARADRPIADNAFRFAVPEGAQQLKRLLPPPPVAPAPMLGKKPEAFTFVGLDGKPVNRESLKNKVVVLDMWATWCGWCFKGLPNLEQVYERYRGNRQVVILAVNKDEPTVSDANVNESFAKAQLTIPIVRDPTRLTDKVFGVQMLPTMVVLGTDGSVQDYRVGYDEALAETLPGKIEKLLVGANLADDALETYRQAQAEYDKQLSEALADIQPPSENNEVARKPGQPK
jgi:thiol-disulfide isomerase/thioredoxin/outer membrane lipoprotein-sorting protein